MEADWEFEVGAGAPVIEARWPGFIDLRHNPERASELAEVLAAHALAETLVTLNADTSPVWTSKCDVWPVVDFAEFDPDELDAPLERAAHAVGCYIDLLPRSGRQWDAQAKIEADCKRVCILLRAMPLRCCRVDLVVRRASRTPDPGYAGSIDLGITAYLTSCGPTEAEAKAVLEIALEAFADAFCGPSTVE
jgi:hypothetical protein